MSLRATRDTTKVVLGVSLRARCVTTLVGLIVMGTYYIKSGVNVKNGIFQLASASLALCVRNTYLVDDSTLKGHCIDQVVWRCM